MVAAVRRGQSLRAVARQFGVGVATVAHWVKRAKGQRLDRVDWSDRSSAPHQTRRTDTSLEDLVLKARRELAHGDLGAIGADAIRQTLLAQGLAQAPSVRTINRILGRRGALDGRPRTRRPAPPRGWYLPRGGRGPGGAGQHRHRRGIGHQRRTPGRGAQRRVACTAAWSPPGPSRPRSPRHGPWRSLVEHWREVGLPDYAQFDNDMIFQGTHRYPDALGRVIRLCLSLAVVPVFVPPQEMGFQAMIESYNGWWQARVWSRFQHANLGDLQRHSSRHVRALRQQRAARSGGGPEAASVPGGLGTGPEETPAGPADLPAANERPGRGDAAGADLAGRRRSGRAAWCAVKWIWIRTRSASSPCGARSRPANRRSWKWIIDCPTGASRTDRPVRDVLALVSIRATKCSGRIGTCPLIHWRARKAKPSRRFCREKPLSTCQRWP